MKQLLTARRYRRHLCRCTVDRLCFRKLQAGRLVYLDIPCGVDGYHTDKTVVYYYGDLDQDPFSDKIRAAYEHCVFLEELTASLLQPGIVIENIYRQVMEQFDPQYETGL